MSLVAAWLLNNSLAEIRANAALALVATGVSVDADGLNFGADGADDVRIAAANNGPLRLPAVSGSSAFSLAMRFRTGSEVTYEQIVHSTDGANYSGYNIVTNSGGTFEFMYGDNTGGSTANRRSFQGPTLAPNTDYDVVVVVTNAGGAADGVAMYVNGAAQTLTPSGTAGAMVYANNDTVFGNWDFYGTSRNSSHRMRKFAIFDHAMTPTEVAAFSADPDAFLIAASSNMTLSGVPASVRRGSQHTISVDGPLAVPTAGNTSVRLGGASGPLMTLDSVTGSGPYLVTFTIPAAAAIQHGNRTLHVTVDTESRDTAAIPFLPPTGQQSVNITTTPATGGDAIGGDYAAFTLANGDQVVALETSIEESLAVSISGAGVVSISGMTEDASFTYYVIRADGTIGAGDTFNVTYSAATLSIVSVNSGQPIESGSNFVVVVNQGALSVASVTLNGVAQSFNATSDTTITVSHTWQNSMYGEDVALSVDGVNHITSVVPAGYVDFEPFPAMWYGNAFATANGTYDSGADGALLADGGAALLVGDQVEFQHPSSNGVAFTVGPDLVPQFAEGNPGYITARILDSADGTFGEWRQYPYDSATPDPDPTRITIIEGLVSGRGVPLAGTNDVPVNVRNADGSLRYSTTINYPASGPAQLDSTQNPPVGTQVFYGFPSSLDGTEALFPATVTAAV